MRECVCGGGVCVCEGGGGGGGCVCVLMAHSGPLWAALGLGPLWASVAASLDLEGCEKEEPWDTQSATSGTTKIGYKDRFPGLCLLPESWPRSEPFVVKCIIKRSPPLVPFPGTKNLIFGCQETTFGTPGFELWGRGLQVHFKHTTSLLTKDLWLKPLTTHNPSRLDSDRTSSRHKT